MLKFTNTLTDTDRQRGASVTPTPHMFTSAQSAGLEAAEFYTRKFVNPVLAGQLSLSDRERIFVGLFYRLYAYCRSLIKLNEPLDFQSVVSATRSIIELRVDIELIHRNVIVDAVQRFDAHTDAQKLSAAKKIIDFFKKNPTLDPPPSPYDPQRDFINNNEAKIDTQTKKFWVDKKGAPRVPMHWSDVDLKARAALLGPEFELMVQEGYDHRNWMIHSGLTGIAGLAADSFTILSGQSYLSAHECLRGALKVLGKELKLDVAITDFALDVEELDHVPSYALLDTKLRSMGDPSRYALDFT